MAVHEHEPSDKVFWSGPRGFARLHARRAAMPQTCRGGAAAADAGWRARTRRGVAAADAKSARDGSRRRAKNARRGDARRDATPRPRRLVRERDAERRRGDAAAGTRRGDARGRSDAQTPTLRYLGAWIPKLAWRGLRTPVEREDLPPPHPIFDQEPALAACDAWIARTRAKGETPKLLPLLQNNKTALRPKLLNLGDL